MSESGYDSGARFFHWLIAILVLAMIPMGLVMANSGPGTLQNVLYVSHESLGLTILALMLLRLLWRLTHRPPPPSAALNRFEIVASGANHWLLYLVLLAMPVSGYLFVVAGGYPLTYFDLAQIPRLMGKDKNFSELAETTHLTLQWAIYALVLLHAAAALHHHFIRRNDVLARMWPGLRN
jgi:cytochrome b561